MNRDVNIRNQTDKEMCILGCKMNYFGSMLSRGFVSIKMTDNLVLVFFPSFFSFLNCRCRRNNTRWIEHCTVVNRACCHVCWRDRGRAGLRVFWFQCLTLSQCRLRSQKHESSPLGGSDVDIHKDQPRGL